MWKRVKSEQGFTVMDTLISLLIFSLLLLCLIKLYNYTIITLDMQVSSGNLYSSYMDLDYKLNAEVRNTVTSSVYSSNSTLQTNSMTFKVDNGVLFLDGVKFADVSEKSSGAPFFALESNSVHVSMYLFNGRDKMLLDALYPVRQ
jgi:hypothetical protein